MPWPLLNCKHGEFSGRRTGDGNRGAGPILRNPAHPLPALRMVAAKLRPLGLHLRPSLEHVRHGWSLPVLSETMERHPVPGMRRMVPAFRLVPHRALVKIFYRSPNNDAELINPIGDSQADSSARIGTMIFICRASPCQGKVEMSYSLQSRNVLFPQVGNEVHVSLGPSVKRRRAMPARNPIEE
jgi:hypothetical protein